MSGPFFDPERFEALRKERGVTWGRPLRLHESVPSTNDLALDAAASEMKTGGVFVAREQTHGRGRRGNTWTSEPGENLTFTLLLRYPSAPQTAQTYPLVVGLAVRAAVALRLERGEERLRVKWPNDVYFCEKKLAGVLVESRLSAHEAALAVGVGLNVLTRDFGPFASVRTSLALALGSPEGERPELAKESLLVDVLAELEKRTRLFVGAGMDAILPELHRYDLLRGRQFFVDGRGGTGAGIDGNGRLLFRPEDDTGEIAIEAGTVAFTPNN